MDQIERDENNIQSLPQNLYEAIESLKKDETIIDGLGEHIFERFVTAKSADWHNFTKAVTQWETDRYFELY